MMKELTLSQLYALLTHPDENVRSEAGKEFVEWCIDKGWYWPLLDESFPEEIRTLGQKYIKEAVENYKNRCIREGWYEGLERLIKDERIPEDIRNSAGKELVEIYYREGMLFDLVSLVEESVPRYVRELAEESAKNLVRNWRNYITFEEFL